MTKDGYKGLRRGVAAPCQLTGKQCLCVCKCCNGFCTYDTHPLSGKHNNPMVRCQSGTRTIEHTRVRKSNSG